MLEKKLSKYTRYSVLWMSLALNACSAVGPNFNQPDAPQVSSFTRTDLPKSSAEATTSNAIASNWWSAYGSSQINRLVELALSHNPNIDAGIANLKAAQELVTAQQGLFYPTVGVGYNFNRQKTAQVISPSLNSSQNPYNLHTAQLNVGYSLDLFGGNRRQVESLRAQAASLQYQLDALRITLASNVVAAAIQAQSLTEQIQIVREAIALGDEQLQQIKRLKAAGYLSGMDLAQQEASYAQTRALLPPLQKQLDQTRDLIAVLCGSYPADLQMTVESKAIQVPEKLPQILPSSLVEQRPDIMAAQEQLHASYAQIGVAVANMLPQINLSADLAFNNIVFGGLFSAANQAWSLLAGITQPLFQGGTLLARKRAAVDQADAARAQYKSTVLTAFQNVADTLYALQADEQSSQAAQDVEKANFALYRQSDILLKQGYISRFMFLTAQQNYLQARLARVVSSATYLGDTVALYQALGGGWRRDTSQSEYTLPK